MHSRVSITNGADGKSWANCSTLYILLGSCVNNVSK